VLHWTHNDNHEIVKHSEKPGEVKLMKPLILFLFTVCSFVPLCAQESVTIKEPAEQCYQDLKATLPEAIRWDDSQMTVTSRPLVTTMSGNVQVVTRVFTEFGQDKKTKEKVEMCRIVVGVDAPQRGTAWNSMNSNPLLQQARMMKARIESTMKARQKKEH
jgi:hypothetical protein